MKKILVCIFALMLFSLGIFAQKTLFEIQGEHFMLNGKPFIIRSG